MHRKVQHRGAYYVVYFSSKLGHLSVSQNVITVSLIVIHIMLEIIDTKDFNPPSS